MVVQDRHSINDPSEGENPHGYYPNSEDDLGPEGVVTLGGVPVEGHQGSVDSVQHNSDHGQNTRPPCDLYVPVPYSVGIEKCRQEDKADDLDEEPVAIGSIEKMPVIGVRNTE